MKIKVTKKVNGTVMLPSIAKNRSFKANQEFNITEDQYWGDDVQAAIRNGIIICNGTVKPPKTITLTSLILGSLSIPGVGILRGGQTIEAQVKDVNMAEVNRLLDQNKITLDKKKVELVQPKSGMIVYKPEELEPVDEKEEKKVKKSPKPKKAANNESIFLDTDKDEDDDEEDDGGIVWADADEDKKRIAAHPFLSKKLKNG